MASAGGVPIWTVASDIAAGGVEREGSSIDSKYLKIIAAAGTQVTEFALVDSGCGRPTIPTDAKFCCNTRDYEVGEDRYSVQAAQGKLQVSTGITDWVVCWEGQTESGLWTLKCFAIKALILPTSVFYMVATGSHGIGFKGSPLSFMDNVNSTGKPAIWQSNYRCYEWLMRKWGVPVIKMINLPTDQMKTIAHSVLVLKDRKGIITLTPPSPSQGLRSLENDDESAYGAGGSAESEKYDELLRVSTHLANELSKFKERVGDVDPLMFAHYLTGHRHP